MHIIKNDDQKFKTLRHIQDFKKNLSEIRKREGTKAAEAFLRAYGSHIGELRQQVREYEKLKQRKLPAGSFSDPTKLGSYLVRARIAVGVTQEALAQKLGVSQPMVLAGLFARSQVGIWMSPNDGIISGIEKDKKCQNDLPGLKRHRRNTTIAGVSSKN